MRWVSSCHISTRHSFLKSIFHSRIHTSCLAVALVGMLMLVGVEGPAQSVSGTASALISIAVTPANPSILAGKTQQFTATGTFTGGTTRDLTNSVTWTSSNPSVATIGGTGTKGLAAALAVGTTTVKAAHAAITGTTVLTVTSASPSLVSITVTPAAPSINVGTEQQFAATGSYSDGSSQDVTNAAEWSSSLPNVATVNTAGMARGVESGQTTIEAELGSVSGTAVLRVSQFTHVFVVFPPPSGTNNIHFMSTVMNQPSIEGVTIPIQWTTIETGTPGPGTCSPVGTDVCQQDDFGWTHTYDWSGTDAANAQWFATQAGTKKVNLILFGMTGASSVCTSANSCFNRDTPYYVTTASWAAHTASGMQDVLNGNKDGCSNYVGTATSSMSRDRNGLVTVNLNGHGYVNGDTIWVGRSTPNNYNIAQETVTSVKVASSVLTITAKNSLPMGTQVTFHSLKKATFLNGQMVTISTSSSTQFTASFSHANYGPTGETAGTASPLGVKVQNATANTFQYQSGIFTADKASAPGAVVSTQQSWNVPYEPPYRTAWQSFIAAAIAHFNSSPHLSQIMYMRVGRSVGGEAYPYCTNNLALLPAPNTYTKTGWNAYYADIDDFVQSQNPAMQIMDPLNEAGDPVDPSYGTVQADIAVAHQNALGNTNGFGSQGMRGNDVSHYAQNPPAYCASDWCGTFDTYYQTIPYLELQQRDLSDPIGLTKSLTGDLRPLLPFAVERHMTILEIYGLDALLAYDPNYCVLTVPDSGVCTTGSVSVAPTDQPPTDLPPQDQYPYFQAVGQPGQTGATGDGSYGAAIDSTHGDH